jgi:deoxyribodipyrimidine photolyase-related protein
MNQKIKTLRFILGDQLNINHPWFAEPPAPNVIYAMAEMRAETDYVAHHIQKVVAFFLAMRNFAETLRQLNHKVVYLTLDQTDENRDVVQVISALVERYNPEQIEYLLPDEYRLDLAFQRLQCAVNIPVVACDTHHFYTTRDELATFFKGKKTFLMENFYRAMRRKHGVLMEGKEPVTGRWNYDEENRKKLPPKLLPPPAKLYPKQVHELVAMIEQAGVKTIGRINADQFIWPVTRDESLDLLNHFVEHLLPCFGTYQDALTTVDWSLFHSRLSFAMNVKLIGPDEVVNAVTARWHADPNHAHIAQVEGFVRQILGWREYMRGIYWAKMPEFATLNFFNHDRALPRWFWTGETRMKCLSHSINQSLDFAYAHHIQRLMVTGNFALLAGIHPDELDRWYLGIYIDAIEWVEITNTRGMSQFADGGIVGSKPYVSSANYLHKQGHYCGSCAYKHDVRVGEKACPFNSLYWHFYHRNRSLLERNPRIGMMYRTWDKMEAHQQAALLNQAEDYLNCINDL